MRQKSACCDRMFKEIRNPVNNENLELARATVNDPFRIFKIFKRRFLTSVHLFYMKRVWLITLLHRPYDSATIAGMLQSCCHQDHRGYGQILLSPRLSRVWSNPVVTKTIVGMVKSRGSRIASMSIIKLRKPCLGLNPNTVGVLWWCPICDL